VREGNYATGEEHYLSYMEIKLSFFVFRCCSGFNTSGHKMHAAATLMCRHVKGKVVHLLRSKANRRVGSRKVRGIQSAAERAK